MTAFGVEPYGQPKYLEIAREAHGVYRRRQG